MTCPGHIGQGRLTLRLAMVDDFKLESSNISKGSHTKKLGFKARQF